MGYITGFMFLNLETEVIQLTFLASAYFMCTVIGDYFYFFYISTQ